MTITPTPEITYAPSDDILRLQLSDDFGASQYQASIYYDLSERPGMEFVDSQLQVQVGEAFGDELRRPLQRPATRVLQFIENLNYILPLDAPAPPVDPVLRLKEIHQTSLSLQVYPQFQRWLNAQVAISEPTGQETTKALGRPFEGSPHQTYAARVNLLPGQFAVAEQVGATNEPLNRAGIANWPRVQLQTAGPRPTIFGTAPYHIAPPIDVNDVRAGHELYTMSSHRIESPRQALSLLLGVGVLARLAAAYQGDEDIFANAKWNLVSGTGWSFTKKQ